MNVEMPLQNALNRNRRYIVKQPALVLITIIIALYTLWSIYSLEISTQYIGVFLLPTAVLIGALIMALTGIGRAFKIGSLFVYLFYLFRYTIVAMAAAQGGFHIDTNSNIYILYFNEACLLMFIEYLVVITVLCYSTTKKESRSVKTDKLFSESNMRSLSNAILILLVICVVCILLYPGLRSNFFYYFASEQDRLAVKLAYRQAQASTPGILFYPFVALVEWLRVVIPIYLVVKIDRSNLGKIKKYFYLIIVIVLSVVFTTHVQITGWFVLLTIFLYLTEKYKNFKKTFLIPFVLIFSYVFILSLNAYSGIETAWMLSRVLQNYFCGPCNIAAGISMPRINNFEYFIIDFLYSNNIISGFTGIGLMYTSTYQFFLHTNDYSMSSIFPFIAQAKFYFGFFLAPAVSGICAWLVSRLELKAYRIENEVYKLLFFYACFRIAASMNMYFVYSVYKVFFEFILFFYLIAWLGKHVTVRF